MFDIERFADTHPAFSDLREVVKLPVRTSHILFVIDGRISIAASNPFGLSKVIAQLRATRFGLAGFSVTLATRDGAAATRASVGPEEFKYTGFRFDQREADGTPTLHRYHQVWCFGFWPGNGNIPGHPNNPNSLDPAADAAISDPANLPTSTAELEVLTRWMNERGGGVFATGDHHLLGSPMCANIPRVSTMRRWRVGDGAPVTTVGLPTRHDTNRPATPAQAAGTAQIPNFVEEDHVPQPIEWVADATVRNGIFVHRRPHPIFCHPKLGPIDVFPDHPHEGHCFDPDDPAWLRTRLDATYDFNGYAGPHYPASGGIRPLPKVLAWGRTLADPPLNFAKGDQPARRFPLVVAYDGQRIGLGRVVVDSTWHHWFDMNIAGLEAAADQGPIEKIRRYYANVAFWLASPTWRFWTFLLDRLVVDYEAFGAQQLVLSNSAYEIGATYREHLVRRFGPCWTSSLIWDLVLVARPDLLERLRRELEPQPWPCLSCAPIEALELAVLGAVVRDLGGLSVDDVATLAREPDAVGKRLARGVGAGLRTFAQDLAGGRSTLAETLAGVAKAD